MREKEPTKKENETENAEELLKKYSYLYDPSKNTPLKIYAQFRIKGAMLDFLRSQDPAPRHRREKEKRGEIEPLKFISLQKILENEPLCAESAKPST